MNTVRLCVPICVLNASALDQSIARAAQVADVIELRLDCLQAAELAEGLRILPTLLRTRPSPLIFTLRPAEQGGHRALDSAERYSFWSLFELFSESDLIDIELDLAYSLIKREPQNGFSPGWNRVICSHHDFTGVPVDLEHIYEQMAGTPARILKIAVQANEITDCLAIFHLLERARRERREIIAVAMGEAGLMTRILAPSRGAFLTYGSLNAEQATAPGQVSAVELRDLYRIHAINEQTEITGLIGSPVAHSVSPHMHNAAFTACGMNAVYIPFEVSDVSGFVRRMVHPRSREIDWKLRGLSVTAPHKTAIMEHLDWIEPSAREIGAVNTVVIEGDALHGYNTDAAAALAPLQGLIELKDARVAIIGAGGVTRAVLWSLQQAGAHATVFARNIERAEHTAQKFGARYAPLDNAHFREFDLVINATPLGTHGKSEHETPVSANQLQGAHVAYDLVYNPSQTRFMREAQEAGCETIGGLAMLVAQAGEQFRLWTGQETPLEAMRKAAKKQLLEVRG